MSRANIVYDFNFSIRIDNFLACVESHIKVRLWIVLHHLHQK